MSSVLPLPPVVRADEAGLERAAEVLRGGGVVGFPTETLYGLAAQALQPESLERLASLKGRDPSRAIPVLVADASQLSLLVSHVPAAAQALMDRHWPGPLTLVLPARSGLPARLLGEGGGVGLRVPSDPVALELVRRVGAPLTATSANRSGEPPATTAEAARLPGLDLVLDDGPRTRPPSTVVAVLDEVPRLLRQGELVLDEPVEPGREETTLDSVRRGELLLEQPRAGYRFGIDPVLLADFVEQTVTTPPRRVVDLGAGVGVVGLLLARRWPEVHVLLIELQPELASLAEANARRNALDDRVEVRCLDLRETSRWRDVRGELVVSNPPFFRVGSGRSSPRAQVSLARHEHACSARELLAAAAAGLPAGRGQLALIHAAERELELIEELGRQGLALRALRRVQPLPERPPGRVLLLAGPASAGTGAARELPPLVVEERPGQLSPEARRLLGD